MRLHRKILPVLLSAILPAVVMPAMAEDFLPPGALHYEEARLDNGLRLVIQRVRSAPYVSLRLVVKTGTSHYPCHDRELPHLVEHLLFSANSTWAENEIDDQVSSWGGGINAFTYAEQTELVLDVHSRFQADAMALAATMISDFAPEGDDIAREIDVVERESGADHTPLRLWWSRQSFVQLAATQFSAAAGMHCAHGLSPLHHLRLADVQNAFRTHYVPANMILILVGDLSAEGISAARAVFSALPAQPAPVVTRLHVDMPSARAAGKNFRSGWLSGTASLDLPMALGIAPFYDWDGYHALLLVESWLNDRMFRELRSERGIAYTPSASVRYEGDALSVVLAVETEAGDTAFVADYLAGLTDEIRARGIPADDFERIRISSLLGMAQSFERIADRADYLAASVREIEADQLFDSETFYENLDYPRFQALVARDWPARFEVIDNSPRVSWGAWIGLLGGSTLLLVLSVGALLWRMVVRRRLATNNPPAGVP